MPICFMLFTHWARRAASRAAWTAGSKSAIKTAMIAITTKSSIRVKPGRNDRRFIEETSRRWTYEEDGSAVKFPGCRIRVKDNLVPGQTLWDGLQQASDRYST